MATFYVGPRPVLKGRNVNDMVNVFKGTAGTYSFYPDFGSGVLDGAPDRNHVPGTGYFPGDVLMSQLFNGTVFYIHPLSGDFADGYGFGRFNPTLFKGLSGAKVFPTNFGHEERENEYKVRQYRFRGVASAEPFKDLGHAYGRTEQDGAPASFGFFQPELFQGTDSSKVFATGYGQEYATTDYGQQRIQEWAGVPSAKAL